jgi:biopolymer transport protein ExbD
MKHLLEVCLVALTLTAPITSSTQSEAAASDNASFAGTWEGKMNNLPGINLRIQETEGGAERKISGDIAFYFQQRDDSSGSWHVAAESIAPLLVPHVEGDTLTFEVQHHRCHGCSELGPNVKFRMALLGANKARLWNLNTEADSSPGLTLIRQTEAGGGPTPPMQKGISVELPVTNNAVPVPEADKPDSPIVTVTYDGSVYLGVSPISPSELAEKLKAAYSYPTEKTVYIKADARAPYASVVKVVDSLGTAGVEGLTLLTAQRNAEEPGTLVPPKGMELRVVSPHRAPQNTPGNK